MRGEYVDGGRFLKVQTGFWMRIIFMDEHDDNVYLINVESMKRKLLYVSTKPNILATW